MEEGTGNGRDFPSFPYPPYDIQLGFMRALYKALDQGGIGLFESPTGTGKTLSLICGSLHWLQDMRAREKAGAEATVPSRQGNDADEEPEWMRNFSSQREETIRQLAEEQRAARISRAKAKLVAQQKAATTQEKLGQPNKDQQSTKGDDLDDEFLLDDVVAEGCASGKPGGSINSGAKRAVLELLSDDDSDMDDNELAGIGEGEDIEPPKKTQIIFCSRTHSQLTQFVGELHRTPFADTFSLVALGSRRSLCINEAVLNLRSPGLINERCLDLQKPQSSSNSQSKKQIAEHGNGALKSFKKTSARSGKKCQFLAAPGSRAADTVRDMILAQPIDVEELAILGKRRSVCPYYASRRVAPEADIVLAPYSALLVADTRKALGLRVEGSVVIVDEAHNLVDAINGSHSAELPASYAATAELQLSGYFDRFRTRLAPSNARNVQALIRVASALASAVNGQPSSSPRSPADKPCPPAAKAFTVNDFLFATGLDNVNVFQLVRYARESKAVFKIAGFWRSVQHQQSQNQETDNNPSNSRKDRGPMPEGATGAIHALVAFLQALTNEDTDGRVIVNPETSSVKFVLLNAAARFASVASQARAVILASGTLSPLDPVLQLFPDIPRDAFHHYSCSHVVGKERLLTLSIGTGPSGVALDFRHATRAAHATMDELGRLLVNVSTCSPGGVVIFFPSFSYAEQVHSRWGATGALAALSAKKKVFREPRTAGEVDGVLEEYGNCIRETSGAILFCIVGGKLAEGINFGDDLGRCAVMVGLPYPNHADPELQERLKFVDRSTQGAECGGQASREHYLNLCMKAVNQCVGRAIRHRQDYAAVLLVDGRYAAGSAGEKFSGPVAKLPGWIQQSLIPTKGFGDAYGRLVRFYKGMRAG